jgi:hypothetical protein
MDTRERTAIEVVSPPNELDRPLTESERAGRFASFDEFKALLGGAGEYADWHHIVEKREPNLGRFGSEAINNIDNLVAIDRGAHHDISGTSSSKRFPGTNGQTLRAYLEDKSFETQKAIGEQVMRDVGLDPEQYRIETRERFEVAVAEQDRLFPPPVNEQDPVELLQKQMQYAVTATDRFAKRQGYEIVDTAEPTIEGTLAHSVQAQPDFKLALVDVGENTFARALVTNESLEQTRAGDEIRLTGTDGAYEREAPLRREAPVLAGIHQSDDGLELG